MDRLSFYSLWGEGVEIDLSQIEATKSQTGEKRRNCIHCGETQFDIIPKVDKVLGIF